jgi:PAS domain S-box-containing protein
LAFNTSPDSININRLEDGTYLETNQGFSRIMGYSREEVLGKTSYEINAWKNLDDRKHLVNVLKEKGKGTGLGLSVVYGIVKEHKGEIKVARKPGEGTCFQVYLPVLPSSDVSGADPDIFPAETGTEHILLVDDEPSIASLEKQMLERLGYKVSKRISSPEALEAFQISPDAYDLVITDMSMPHMTGEDLAKELLRIRPNIPIIISTGFSERFNEEDAKALGIKGFLMKPVIKSDMAKEIRRVLD